ncbi:MAG: 50S ribosomal protein L6 [Candidatus Pacearchaeota archaeon]|jgi:large subunit ribosomal protein L6
MENKKERLLEEIEIPGGINAVIENEMIILKKNNNTVKRKLNPILELKVDGNKIIIEARKSTKRERKMFGTMIAHINNMIKGLNENFRYRLQAASVHFPMTLSHDKATNELVVKNFLGEKKDRRIKLIEGVNLKLNKDIIELDSVDIEVAGQTAANIENGTKVRKRDRRIFQDGIFIIEKPGVSYL